MKKKYFFSNCWLSIRILTRDAKYHAAKEATLFFFLFFWTKIDISELLHLQTNASTNQPMVMVKEQMSPLSITTKTLTTMADKLILRVCRHQALSDKRDATHKDNGLKDSIWQLIMPQKNFDPNISHVCVISTYNV